MNLEQHAAVLERLIGLNTELMDQVNARTAAKLRQPPPPAAAPQVASWAYNLPSARRVSDWQRRFSCTERGTMLHIRRLQDASSHCVGSGRGC